MWVHLDPDDALLLDARMQHSGEICTAPRYFFVLGYVREDAVSSNQLLSRWRQPLATKELEYYRFLNQHQLCSDSLLAACRAAAGRAPQ